MQLLAFSKTSAYVIMQHLDKIYMKIIPQEKGALQPPCLTLVDIGVVLEKLEFELLDFIYAY